MGDVGEEEHEGCDADGEGDCGCYLGLEGTPETAVGEEVEDSLGFPSVSLTNGLFGGAGEGHALRGYRYAPDLIPSIRRVLTRWISSITVSFALSAILVVLSIS